MRESNIQSIVALKASQIGARLFRNNVAKGWIGKHIEIKKPGMFPVEPGDVVIKNARRLNSGLHVGSGDLIGFYPVTITQEMVGKKMAVFVSAEVKASKGRPTDDQKNWDEMVRHHGGISGIIRSESDIENLLTDI